MDCPTGQKMWAMETVTRVRFDRTVLQPCALFLQEEDVERKTRETGESARSTSASCSPEKGEK